MALGTSIAAVVTLFFSWSLGLPILVPGAVWATALALAITARALRAEPGRRVTAALAISGGGLALIIALVVLYIGVLNFMVVR